MKWTWFSKAWNRTPLKRSRANWHGSSLGGTEFQRVMVALFWKHYERAGGTKVMDPIPFSAVPTWEFTMKGSRPINALCKLFTNILQLTTFAILIFFLNGCTSVSSLVDEKEELYTKIHPLSGDPDKQKSIFVFLDGTANDGTANEGNSKKNVWRLYETIKASAEDHVA